MYIEHTSKEQLQKEIAQTLSRNVDSHNYRAFFFGSRVTGKHHEGSDIDVGIQGEKPVPPAAWSAIVEEIENIPTLYTIDIVDFAKASEDVRKLALQQTEPIPLV